MQSFGNERQVQQGEDWNLDILLSASDKEYIPYIISSQRNHPFFVVTVASTKFEKNLRYVESWWNDIKSGEYKIPLFFQTVPQYYGEIEISEETGHTVDLGEIIRLENIVFTKGNDILVSGYLKDNTGTVKIDVVRESGTETISDICSGPILYKYTLRADGEVYYFKYDARNQQLIVSQNFADVAKFRIADIPTGITEDDNIDRRLLYYYTVETDEIDPTLGHKPYYYFYYEYTEVEYMSRMVLRPMRIDDYECHVRFNFSSEVTAKWGSQNYMYQITLVDGILMEEKLQQIFDEKEALGEIKAEQWPTDITKQYQLVKLMWPKALQPDIDATSPLGKIELPEPILPPTKLEVFNNLRTLI